MGLNGIGIIAKNGRCSISAEQDDPPKYIRYGKAPSAVPNALRGSVGTAEGAFPYKLAHRDQSQLVLDADSNRGQPKSG